LYQLDNYSFLNKGLLATAFSKEANSLSDKSLNKPATLSKAFNFFVIFSKLSILCFLIDGDVIVFSFFLLSKYKLVGEILNILYLFFIFLQFHSQVYSR